MKRRPARPFRSAASVSRSSQYAQQLLSQIEPVPVATRAQAIAKVRRGDVLAAVVIPRNIAARLVLRRRRPRTWK